MKPKSLIKWTGSKRSQASEIASYFPSSDRYFEPFLGSGAILYFATKHFKKCFASDLYNPLISIWEFVKNNPTAFSENYKLNWNNLQSDFPDYYYKVRDRFNNVKNPVDLNFLMRTCVNGIVRFNKKGDFNNSLHVSRRGMKPHLYEKIVDEWHLLLKTVEFKSCDYTAILDHVTKGDFVYLDPPYFNSSNRYIEDLNYDKFLSFLEKLNSLGVMFALSFDGLRGNDNFSVTLPEELYRTHKLICNGHSAVKNVLSSEKTLVHESLYLNYSL
jgi:DNA adenine methylase